MSYEFTGKTLTQYGVVLRQIQAINHPHIPTGEIGGWIENPENLSGNAWVSGDAWVSEDARVYGNARVSEGARVSGNARVLGNAWVYGNAWVFGNAVVHGDARVSGDARVYGSALVYGNARIYGDARVSEGAVVSGMASPEEIRRLDEVREIVLASPLRLDMSIWHSEEWTPDHNPEEEHTCGSTHCIAGWLQALSPDLEIRKLSAERAGFTLAPCSAWMFYRDNDTVLTWLKNREYAGVELQEEE